MASAAHKESCMKIFCTPAYKLKCHDQLQKLEDVQKIYVYYFVNNKWISPHIYVVCKIFCFVIEKQPYHWTPLFTRTSVCNLMI